MWEMNLLLKLKIKYKYLKFKDQVSFKIINIKILFKLFYTEPCIIKY